MKFDRVGAMKKLALLLMMGLSLEARGARLFVRTTNDTVTAVGSASNYGTANQSYSFWFYPTSSPAQSTEWIIWLDWAGTGQISMVLSYEWNGTFYALRAASSSSLNNYQFRYFYATGTNGVAAIGIGWHHMVVTVEPGLGSSADVKWYVDGAGRNRYSDTGGSWSPGNGFYGSAYLGSNNGTSSCDARIADFVWWQGVVLNAHEVAALARGQQPEKVHPNPKRNYGFEGLRSPELDRSAERANTISITGTSRANGPPVIPR
jgi:hypothetical protein